jgi:small subunit ribosomal protein S6
MVRYETLFLAVPELTNDEFSMLETSVGRSLQETKANIISFERWGKYKLAYPVRKNEYGIYGLIRFEVDSQNKHTALETIKTLLTIKYGDTIMRTMTVGLEPNQALSYHRPESLEEVPVRDVDVFLKENKMEGLLANKKSAPKVSVQDLEEDEDQEVEELDDEAEKFLGDVSVAAATPPSEGN